MGGIVVLQVKDDARFEGRFVFLKPAYWMVGRSKVCQLRIPGNLKFYDISRRHCLFRIEPPEIHICDLGSRNGTYVNGAKIGQRKVTSLSESQQQNSNPEWLIHDGDEIRIGHVRIYVQICPDTTSAKAKGIGTSPTPAMEQQTAN